MSWLVPLTACFLLGLTVGHEIPETLVPGLAVTTAGLALLALISPARLLLLMLFCLTVGATHGALSPTPPPPGSRAPQRVQGILAAPPARAPAPGICRLELTQTWVAHARGWRPGPPGITLRLPTACDAALTPDARRPGTRLRFRARLRPGPPGRPWRAMAPPGSVVPVGRQAPPSTPLTARIRTAAVARIAPWRQPGRALLAAVVVGERQWLAPHHRARFQRTGTAHLLAISGLHVGLVAGLCFALMRRLWGWLPGLARRWAPLRVAALFALVATWLFVAVSGAATPALRAGIMTTALLLGPLFGRRGHGWTSLALAALVLLLWDPGQLSTPGFQLSFVAVAAILTVLPRLRRLTTSENLHTPVGAPPPHPWRNRLVQLVGVTAAATCATLPLVAHHFGQASGAGLLLNLLVVPLFSAVVVPLGLAGTLLSLLWDPAGQPLLSLAANAAELLQALVAWGDATLTARAALRWCPNGLETLCCYGAALGLLWIRRWQGQLALAVALAVGLLSAGLCTLGPGGGAALRVIFLDVGKGDAALVSFPDGRHALVDAPGPTRGGYSATRRQVLPTLRKQGIRTLDLVIASHPHADHIGGLPEVLQQIPVKALWHGGQIHTVPEARPLLRAAATHRVPLHRARNRRFGRVTLTVLAPRLRDGASGRLRGRVAPHPLRSVNDNSLVIRLDHPTGALLLTGDLEHAGEAALLTASHRPLLNATVLKVGHHGSPTASSPPFLRAVSPRLAILSAPGARPGRPFPSPLVLSRLRRVGARPLITGREGNITVTIAPWGISYHSRSGTFQLTPKGWRPAPPWPSITAILKDPRILLP